MALTAERLRNNDRFSGENVTQFLLYLPFGLCLFVFRIILALILWVASIILPNKSTVRQMLSTLACWTFGVYVKVKGTREPRCSMLVANYASCLDSLAAAHALGTISLRKWKVPPFFASTLGIRNAAQFVRKEHFGSAASAPLLLQPEGGPGNGRGLLKFADWPFPVATSVQPVAIVVERMFTRVTVHAGHSGGFPWRDALWFLLSPVTVFRLTLLPCVSVRPDTAHEEPARLIAEHLQIEATDIEYSALCRASAAPRRAVGAAPRELARRAQQVKEVLPRVPLDDIMRDLGKRTLPSPAPRRAVGAAPRELARRAQQVKEVLPRVPLDDIMRDLGKRTLPSPAPRRAVGAAPRELARRAQQVKEVLPRVPLDDIMRDLGKRTLPSPAPRRAVGAAPRELARRAQQVKEVLPRVPLDDIMRDLGKRTLPSPAPRRAVGAAPRELARRAQQVKEVLPRVPLDDIMRDLGKRTLPSPAPRRAVGAAPRELARRAQQVKEVLPRVPLDDIMRDLGKRTLPSPAPRRAVGAVPRELARRAQQVKEVLPRVPLDDIMRDLGKRTLPSPAPRRAVGAVPRELARRAQQVKEVLPRVPLDDIMRDLALTRSVDVTVTNFLEGVTPYTPEPLPPSPGAGPSRAPPAPPAPAPPRYVTPAPQAPFPRSARERQLSFQERKAQMIADARQRYIEKHGLDLAMTG